MFFKALQHISGIFSFRRHSAIFQPVWKNIGFSMEKDDCSPGLLFDGPHSKYPALLHITAVQKPICSWSTGAAGTGQRQGHFCVHGRPLLRWILHCMDAVLSHPSEWVLPGLISEAEIRLSAGRSHMAVAWLTCRELPTVQGWPREQQGGFWCECSVTWDHLELLLEWIYISIYLSISIYVSCSPFPVLLCISLFSACIDIFG